jgi:hypothetical protein
MAESHISLCVVRGLWRAVDHASSLRAIQGVNRIKFEGGATLPP